MRCSRITLTSSVPRGPALFVLCCPLRHSVVSKFRLYSQRLVIDFCFIWPRHKTLSSHYNLFCLCGTPWGSRFYDVYLPRWFAVRIALACVLFFNISIRVIVCIFWVPRRSTTFETNSQDHAVTTTLAGTSRRFSLKKKWQECFVISRCTESFMRQDLPAGWVIAGAIVGYLTCSPGGCFPLGLRKRVVVRRFTYIMVKVFTRQY